MAQVVSFTAVVPVKGDLYGDVTRSIFSVVDQLTKKGWLATGRGIETSTRFGSPVYGKVEFTLRKKGKDPFEDSAAQNAITSAASSIGLKLGILKDWVVQSLSFAKDIPKTTVTATMDLAARKKAEYDLCIAKGGNPITCAGGSIGLPSWVFPAALGLGALLLIGQVASIKRSFSGFNGNLNGLGCVHRGRSRRRR